MDMLTEILQERLLEMTNHVDRKEKQLLARIQASEDKMQKTER